MKRGRASWIVKCPSATVEAVRLAVAGGHASARDIYDRFELATFVRARTFRAWVTQQRRALESRRDSSPELGETCAKFGNRGLQRLRENELAKLQPRELAQAAVLSLHDLAAHLRQSADGLIDLARAFSAQVHG